MDQLIKLLKNNARITNSELAVLLDKSEEQVAADIAKLEADGGNADHHVSYRNFVFCVQ